VNTTAPSAAARGLPLGWLPPVYPMMLPFLRLILVTTVGLRPGCRSPRAWAVLYALFFRREASRVEVEITETTTKARLREPPSQSQLRPAAAEEKTGIIPTISRRQNVHNLGQPTLRRCLPLWLGDARRHLLFMGKRQFLPPLAGGLVLLQLFRQFRGSLNRISRQNILPGMIFNPPSDQVIGKRQLIDNCRIVVVVDCSKRYNHPLGRGLRK
jgi:hypothetical protein